MTQLVSVVIPAFNAESTIEETVASVLRQTWPDFEVVVVDDGSADRTAERVQAIADRDQRVRLYRQENRGVAEARNRAVRESRGDWIAPLDSDDIYHPEALAEYVRCAASGSDRLAVVYCWSIDIDERGSPMGRISAASVRGDVFATILCHNFLGNGSCTMIRRTALEHAGGYDPAFPGTEDWLVCLRLAEDFEFAPVPRVLVGYRQGARSLSRNYEAAAVRQAAILEGVRRRHPNVPRWLCRLSQSSMLIYFAGRSREEGRIGAMRRWLRRAAAMHGSCLVRPDWWYLFVLGGWRPGRLPRADVHGGDPFAGQPGWLPRVTVTRCLQRLLGGLVPAPGLGGSDARISR